ncbi:MAG TPA: hypothetical protein VGA79_08260 [Desulfobaccales bacterium]
MLTENVKEAGASELEVLRGMVLAWKEDYSGSVPPDGGGEYLCQDFSYEIEEYVYPYLRRMVETDHISQDQAREFLEFCYRQVMELRDLIEEPKPPT